MKCIARFICLLFIFTQHSTIVCAQSDSLNKIKGGRWHKSSISLQFPYALGKFSDTHIAGAGADYSLEFNKENDFFHIAFNTGITYYLGKKETISGYKYKYPGFTFLHLMGGVHCWINEINVRLLAGPALGIYNGQTRFNISSRLEGNYFINTTFMIGPTLNIMLEPGTSSLWSVGIRGTIVL